MKRIQLCISITAAAILFSCKPVMGPTSGLADVMPAERKYMQEECNKKSVTRVVRVSRIEMTENLGILLIQNNFCNAAKKPKKQSFGLTDKKPVFVYYGSAGNAPSDQIEIAERQGTLAWAQKDYRVVDLSGMDISQAQQRLMADRRANPGDYDENSHVNIKLAAHGWNNPDSSQHEVVSSYESQQGSTQVRETRSMRTTDVQSALLEGVGHQAGTIAMHNVPCEVGGVQNDPQFQRIQQSQINPDQKRVFVLSSGADRTAWNPVERTSQGYQQSMPMEQSFAYLAQRTDASQGLTAGQAQQLFQQGNLGNPTPTITTMVVSDGGDTTGPTGGMTFSHLASEFNYTDQQPTVIGPSDAFVIPPGIGPLGGPLVNTEADHRQQYDNVPIPGVYPTDTATAPAPAPAPQPAPIQGGADAGGGLQPNVLPDQ